MILVTGGTGFVGRHLVSRFVAEGRPVRVLARNPSRAGVPSDVTLVAGDLSDGESLRKALRDVRVVVHAAAALPGPGVTDDDLERTNVGGTGCLARLAVESGVRSFIHLSSSGVYGDRPPSGLHAEVDPLLAERPYPRSKLSSERELTKALEGTPVRWIILRPAGLYGPDRPATRALFRDIARRRLWLHGPSTSRLHPTHVDDLTQAVALVVDHDDLHGEALNIGGSRPVTYAELIALIGARVGRVPIQLSAPAWTRRFAASVAGAWRAVGRTPAVLERLAREGDNSAVDIAKARRLIGFDPIELEDGLERTAVMLRTEGVL